VIVEAASPHRKTANAPICSGVVYSSIGCFSRTRSSRAFSTGMPCTLARASICCCTSGVNTQPGQIALQVMP
jgi:hypothetical protein